MATVTPGQFIGPTQAQIKEQQLQRQTQAFQNMDKSLQSALRLKEAQRQFNVENYFKTLETAMDEYVGGPQQFLKDKHVGIAKDLSKLFGGGIFGRNMGEKAFQDLLKGRMSARQMMNTAASDWAKNDIIALYNDTLKKNEEIFPTTVAEEEEVVEPVVSEPDIIEPNLVPESEYIKEQAAPQLPLVVEETPPVVTPPEITRGTIKKIPGWPRGLNPRALEIEPALLTQTPIEEEAEERPMVDLIGSAVVKRGKATSIQGYEDKEGRFLSTRPPDPGWQNATAIAWDAAHRLVGGDNPDPSLVGRVWEFVAAHTDKTELPKDFNPKDPYKTLDEYNPDRNTFHIPKNMEELEAWEKGKETRIEPETKPEPESKTIVDEGLEKSKFLERFSEMAGLTSGLDQRVGDALDKTEKGEATSKSEDNMLANSVGKITFKMRKNAAEGGSPKEAELKMYANLLTKLQGSRESVENNPALVDLFATEAAITKRKLSQADKETAVKEDRLRQDIVEYEGSIEQWNKQFAAQGEQFAQSIGLEWAKLDETERYHLALMGQTVAGQDAVANGDWTKQEFERFQELGKRWRPLELEAIADGGAKRTKRNMARICGMKNETDTPTAAYKSYLEWLELCDSLYVSLAGGIGTREKEESAGVDVAEAALKAAQAARGH